MNQYVIAVEWQGKKKYVLVNLQNQTTTAVEDKTCATGLPSRAVAYGVIKAIKPLIEKECPGVKVTVEVK